MGHGKSHQHWSCTNALPEGRERDFSGVLCGEVFTLSANGHTKAYKAHAYELPWDKVTAPTFPYA